MNAEATRLDHRDLNHDLRVFATDPLAGAPLWLPESEADLIRLAAGAHSARQQRVSWPG
jgi:hypothetical protein